MNGSAKGMGWGARLLIALVFILLGAGAAVWGLAHYPKAAKTLGIAPATQGTVTPAESPVQAVEPTRPAAPPLRLLSSA